MCTHNRIPLTLSFHSSQSAIALIRSSRRYPESAQCYLMYVFAVQPTLVCPYLRGHERMSLMTSAIISPAVPSMSCSSYLVCEMTGNKPNICCFVRYLLQGFFSKQPVASLCSSHPAFHSSISLKSKWCKHTDSVIALIIIIHSSNPYCLFT